MPLDYSDYLDKEPADSALQQEAMEQRGGAEETANKKGFSLEFLKSFWYQADSKTKKELIVLFVVIGLIIAVAIYYFASSGPPEKLPLPLPAEY